MRSALLGGIAIVAVVGAGLLLYLPLEGTRRLEAALRRMEAAAARVERRLAAAGDGASHAGGASPDTASPASPAGGAGPAATAEAAGARRRMGMRRLVAVAIAVLLVWPWAVHERVQDDALLGLEHDRRSAQDSLQMVAHTPEALRDPRVLWPVYEDITVQRLALSAAVPLLAGPLGAVPPGVRDDAAVAGEAMDEVRFAVRNALARGRALTPQEQQDLVRVAWAVVKAEKEAGGGTAEETSPSSPSQR